MSSINKVILIGNLGADPEIRAMQSGDEVANFNIATAERWKDKNTGEQKEKTEWHRVCVFNPGLVKVVKNYIKKGSKVYIEGQLQTRKWQDKDGTERYTTEVVMKGYNSTLVMLDTKGSNQQSSGGGYDQSPVTQDQTPPAVAGLDDEIPF